MAVTINLYFIIIITTMLFAFGLEFISNQLNLKTLSKPMPGEFSDVFSEDKYKKSQAYTRSNTRFSLFTSTFDLIVILAFWFLGGFGWVDELVRGYGYGPIVTGLVFFGILGIANYIISMPFSIYHTFVLEEKFGFNKTTAKIFILDQVKALALSIILGGLLLGVILWIFNVLGEEAWIYTAVITILFILFIQAVAPVWIMPLFNKFTPIDNGELKESIENFAKKVKFPLSGIFTMDGSKRSSKSNAFFTGFGKNKRIALFDTLIEKHSVGELVAILAHEIGHYKKKHILIGTIISMVETAVTFYLFSLFLNNSELASAFAVQHTSVYTSLVFFGLLFSPISMILSLFGQILSRRNEYEADRFAAENINEKEEMISALKRLSADNLSNLTPHSFYVFLNYSHPPVLQRIRAIQNFE